MDAYVISAIFIDACTVQLVLQIEGKLYCMNKLLFIGLFNSNSILDRMYSICNIIYIPLCKEKIMYISPVEFCVQPVLKVRAM